MIDPTVVVGLVALVGIIGTPVVSALLGRNRTSAAENRLNHDELQEDFAALREEFRLYKKEITAQLAYDGAVIRHLDNEVVEIRRGVEAGMVPPLLPRPPWPTEITA